VSRIIFGESSNELETVHNIETGFPKTMIGIPNDVEI